MMCFLISLVFTFLHRVYVDFSLDLLGMIIRVSVSCILKKKKINQIVHKQAQAYSTNIYTKLEHLILFDNELKLNNQI